MDLELRDKVAIVGGASKGLGRACAEVLAQEGAHVAICSRSKDDLEKAASEIRAASGREVLVFSGDLSYGQHHTVQASPPVRVQSTDGSLQVTVAGQDRGRMGPAGRPATQSYVARR